MYIIDKMPHGIDIGYTGETGFRTVEIDMTPWMEKVPDGVPSIVAIRPGETMDDAYVVATSFDGKVLTWQITAGDIGTNQGDGLIQIWLEKYANGSTVKRGKSKKVVTHVSHAINHASDEVPAAQEAFLEQITVLKTQIVDNATAAVTSAVTAAQNATIATNKAEEATGSATAAAESATTASGFANDASGSANDSRSYRNGARVYAQQALTSASTASTKATEAAGSASDAAGYALGASTSASRAAQNATAAASSKSDAEAWAVGKRNGAAVASSDETYKNNAKYYSDLAEQVASNKGYMDFYIDTSGHLIYQHSQNMNNVDFQLSNGRLIAVWQ